MTKLSAAYAAASLWINTNPIKVVAYAVAAGFILGAVIF